MLAPFPTIKRNENSVARSHYRCPRFVGKVLLRELAAYQLNKYLPAAKARDHNRPAVIVENDPQMTDWRRIVTKENNYNLPCVRDSLGEDNDK